MGRGLRILFIDDSDDDRTLFNMAAKRFRHAHMISTVESAQGAIQLLEQKERQSSPLPDLLLVDLRMPVMDGFEFLEWLRAHPRFRSIPAVVLSGSVLKDDISKAYRLGAKSYLTKPVRLDELAREISALFAFWSACELPPKISQIRLDLN